MKKLLSLSLVLILLLSLCGCDKFAKVDYYAKVTGSWKMDYLKDTELQQELLTSIELYDEEIALVTARLHGIKVVTFNQDKTYSFSQPVEENQACVREFFDRVFDSLYLGQAELKGLYEQDISTMSEADFKQFYAQLYGAENYEALLDKLAENSFDWTKYGITEEGTYTIGSEQIKVDTDGTEHDGNIKYTLEDDVLTLSYADGTERYSKAD